MRVLVLSVLSLRGSGDGGVMDGDSYGGCGDSLMFSLWRVTEGDRVELACSCLEKGGASPKVQYLRFGSDMETMWWRG